MKWNISLKDWGHVINVDVDFGELVHRTDLSEAQCHLVDINNRYKQLGERLSDRQKDLEETVTIARRYLEDLQDVLTWLDDKEQMMLPLNTLPANEDEAKVKLLEHQVKYSHTAFTTVIFLL